MDGKSQRLTPSTSAVKTTRRTILGVLGASVAALALVSGTLVPPQAEQWLQSLRRRGTRNPPRISPSISAVRATNATGDGFGATTWYFAHGQATSAPDTHHTWLLLANPGGATTQASIQFRLDDGQVKTVPVEVEALGRTAVYANQFVTGRFSTTVTSSAPLVAEESVFFANDGYTVPGVATPSTIWYLPEGYRGSPYDCTIHILNPSSAATAVTLYFYGEAGATQQVMRDVAGQSVLHFSVTQECQLQGAVATQVVATAPVVVQRVTYFPGRDGGRGGHAATGISTLASTWYLPLALADVSFDTWLMLFNPGDAAVTVEAHYLTAGGDTIAAYAVPSHSRTTLWVDKEKLEGRAPDAAFGVALVGNAAFATESVTYDAAYQAGTASAGAPALARLWFFAEGSTGAPYTTYLALFNPGPTGAAVRASFMPSSASSPTPGWALLPGELKLINLNEIVKDTNAGFSLSSDAPVVAQRLMTMTGSGLLGGLGLPAEPPAQHPVAYVPIVLVPPRPIATPTATREPGVSPTPVRRADTGEYVLASAITGTANCGTTGVKGRITDAGGQPIPNLRVRVWAEGWTGSYSNPSDTDGRWDFVLGSGPRAGTWYAAIARDDGTLLSPIVLLPTSSDCHNGHQWLEINWRQRQEALPQYALAWSRRLSCQENAQNHNLFIDVTDANGNGLPGVVLRVSWDGGQTEVQTGNKLDVGPGRVEFAMYKGTYSLQVLGGSSDVAAGLTVDLPDETVCDNHGNTLYHYSYHIVLRRG